MPLKRFQSPPGTSTGPRSRFSLGLLALTGLLFLPHPASAQSDGGKYLDAKFCGDSLNLNPGSQFDGGSCQLWKMVPDADGWSRLQLKHNGKFLDAKFCRDDLHMDPGSTYDNGACQLWKFVPSGDPRWARLQLKKNGKFLDAANCSDNVQLSGPSGYEGGACQLWRLIPAGGEWFRLQVKFGGGAGPIAANDEEFAWQGQTYGWYDDGWNGPGYYVVDSEDSDGEGFGGREGWHGWHHHGNHHHHHGHSGKKGHGNKGKGNKPPKKQITAPNHKGHGQQFKNLGKHNNRGRNLRNLGRHGSTHFKNLGSRGHGGSHRGGGHGGGGHGGGGGHHGGGGGGRRHR